MSSLFSTGLSGLNVARTALATTAQNTANVYTEGYSRQKVVIQTNPANATIGGFLGSGARVTSVQRSYDDFLAAQLSRADSSASGLETYATQISRLDDLLADRDSGLSALMQKFFTGVQGVADTPADPAARQEMLSTAAALAGKFRSVDQYLTDLNASLNEQIAGGVSQVNAIATQVASLNRQISQLSAATGGQPPNDLLDTRDKLVNDLSKLVDVAVVRQDGGQYNLFVGSGQTLVLGDRAATMAAVTSAADPTRTAVALVGVDGKPIELRDGEVGGGALGGVLAFRSQSLVGTQNSIGRLATVLAQAFNAQHGVGWDLHGALGGDFFSVAAPKAFPNDRNGGNLELDVAITDAAALTTSDYRIERTDAASFSVVSLPDGAVVKTFGGFPVTFDGVTVRALGGGSAAVGDSFLVQPTRFAARDFAVEITDPAKIAAAAGPVSSAATGSGEISAPAVDPSYSSGLFTTPIALTYDSGTGTLNNFPTTAAITVTPPGTSYPVGTTSVPYTDGASISFGGISFTISGTLAHGDTFTLAPQATGVSDSSNALRLAALQRQALVGGSATFNGAYARLVSEVGNKAMEVEVAYTSQSSLAGQVRASLDSVAGVNQDEETAN
ncbi:MAG TPA: flagellar hook-associated protein FlgK, partial [Ramlibacter sp.]